MCTVTEGIVLTHSTTLDISVVQPHGHLGPSVPPPFTLDKWCEEMCMCRVHLLCRQPLCYVAPGGSMGYEWGAVSEVELFPSELSTVLTSHIDTVVKSATLTQPDQYLENCEA